jgi:2-iminobutanoate/2-iminopropanoate deaminase
MNKKIVKTENAPQAIGPYSQAVLIGDMLFTSGQIPIDVTTGNIPDTIEEQAKVALGNVKGVVEAAGLTMDNIIKMTVFIADMNDFAKVNEVYETFFKENYPSRSCVEVSRLPKDVLIEIEAIAHK